MSHFDTILAMALAGEGGGGGSSDFSTAEVTVVYNIPNSFFNGVGIIIYQGYMAFGFAVETNSEPLTENFQFVLYKGSQSISFDNGDPDYETYTNIAVTGDLTVDEYGNVTVSGNGTITISAGQ